MAETTQTQEERISTYVKIVNTTVIEADEALLDFAVSEILDRVRLYLNRDDVPVLLERPLAKVVSSIFNKYKKTGGDTDVEQVVSSVSDNGQSVSYSNSVKSYLTSSSDEEVFTGITGVLNRYRRLNFNATTSDVQ